MTKFPAPILLSNRKAVIALPPSAGIDQVKSTSVEPSAVAVKSVTVNGGVIGAAAASVVIECSLDQSAFPTELKALIL